MRAVVRQRINFGIGAIVVSVVTMLAGCGDFFIYPGKVAATTTPSGNIVYVANGGQTVSGFAIGTATLTAVANSPYALNFAPTSLALTPANSFLYVGGALGIYGYSIGAGGVLTGLSSGLTLASGSAAAMDISPDGQWLIVLDSNALTIEEYQINATTGALTTGPLTTYISPASGAVARAIRVAPSGAYVFAALGTGGDLVYNFNTSNGALTGGLGYPPLSPTSSDNGLAVSPNSATLYIARSGTGSGIATYAIGTGGALTAVAGSPYTAGNQPFAVATDAAGSNVYLANRSDGTISGYAIGTSGALAALSGSPYASGASPTALAPDSTGKYLLAATNGVAPNLYMYAFDGSIAGRLDLSTTTFAGTGPVALAVTH